MAQISSMEQLVEEEIRKRLETLRTESQIDFLVHVPARPDGRSAADLLEDPSALFAAAAGGAGVARSDWRPSSPHSVLSDVWADDVSPPFTDDLMDSLPGRVATADLTRDGGVVKRTLRDGVGPAPRDGAKIWFRYELYLADVGDEPFDAKFTHRLKPAILGRGNVIEGLEFALASMRRGEKALVKMTPEYAYLDLGCPPFVPPDSTVFAVVHLVKIGDCVPAAADGDPADLSAAELTMREKLKDAVSLGQECKAAVGKGDYDAALDLFRRAKDVFWKQALSDPDEQVVWSDKLCRLYALGVAAAERAGRPGLVCDICQEMPEDPNMPAEGLAKLFYKWGKSMTRLASHPEDFDLALSKLEEARKLTRDPRVRRDVAAAAENLRVEREKSDKSLSDRVASASPVVEGIEDD